MKSLYLILILGTLAGPLALSFDKNVRYFKSWKSALLSSLIIAVPFLIWDAFFTERLFWGFNEEYLLGIYLFNLPLEEVLFFIIIPFACTFIYEVCKYFFRSYSLKGLNKMFYFAIPLYALTLLSLGDFGYYTISVQISSTLILVWMILNAELRYLSLAFLISLIPFIVVNGILTGSLTENPVVWYNEAQIVSPRILTIPMEDILYSFTLVVANMILFEKLQRRFSK
jgi:lycopene cyclase domain-containing protein